VPRNRKRWFTGPAGDRSGRPSRSLHWPGGGAPSQGTEPYDEIALLRTAAIRLAFPPAAVVSIHRWRLNHVPLISLMLGYQWQQRTIRAFSGAWRYGFSTECSTNLVTASKPLTVFKSIWAPAGPSTPNHRQTRLWQRDYRITDNPRTTHGFVALWPEPITNLFRSLFLFRAKTQAPCHGVIWSGIAFITGWPRHTSSWRQVAPEHLSKTDCNGPIPALLALGCFILPSLPIRLSSALASTFLPARFCRR